MIEAGNSLNGSPEWGTMTAVRGDGKKRDVVWSWVVNQVEMIKVSL